MCISHIILQFLYTKCTFCVCRQTCGLCEIFLARTRPQKLRKGPGHTCKNSHVCCVSSLHFGVDKSCLSINSWPHDQVASFRDCLKTGTRLRVDLEMWKLSDHALSPIFFRAGPGDKAKIYPLWKCHQWHCTAMVYVLVQVLSTS